LGDRFQLRDGGVEVRLDVLGVLVRVDPEIAEMTALPAKRDVMIKTELSPRNGL
jgi:hypothetical protein